MSAIREAQASRRLDGETRVVEPRERPILFQAAMVKGLLAGTKTQTRRLAKTEPGYAHMTPPLAKCPYGAPGDRLWVRETWVELWDAGDFLTCLPPTGEAARTALRRAKYRATDTMPEGFAAKWKPSIFMPRWASRITLEVTEVRVQRLQDISEEDARAEGVTTDAQQGLLNGKPATLYPMTHRQAFVWLWDAINGKRAAWASNPWVWCVSFWRLP